MLTQRIIVFCVRECNINSFRFATTKWNELSVENRNIDKYENFKSSQKKWLLNTINL